ncbi:MAG: 2-phosphosulfolactate phosphatase [Planctomycetia bacterium]|nr:2-phosphosulfolactate phosphatase [Planctomycetia bacterium]
MAAYGGGGGGLIRPRHASEERALRPVGFARSTATATATATAIMIQTREGIAMVSGGPPAGNGMNAAPTGTTFPRLHDAMIHWHCHVLYQRLAAHACVGGIAVVIDVLRASTTIVTALAHGADRVMPVAAIDDARRMAAESRPAALLGGERGGVRLPGFDLGNSPLEYSAARVSGRTIVITTTNGTAALAASRGAREILLGAIVNRTAVAEAVRRFARDGDDVHLVCAGTDGLVSAEDVLAAGAILDAAGADRGGDGLDLAAHEALASFRRVAAHSDATAALVAEFRRSPGGENLVALGMEADLPAAAAIDTLPVVPRFDAATGSLLPALLHSRP